MLAISGYAGDQAGAVSLMRETATHEGWTVANFRHSKGAWMNRTLVMKTEQGNRKTFDAQYAFIVGWNFCRDDSCVVIQSQNAHGPYYWQLFDISSGKVLEEFYRSKTDDVPDWVIDFTVQRK